jgi:uncharacterized membrane protein
MNLQPIWAAPTAVQIHLAFALVAFALGIFMFARRKGTPSHKAYGRIWMALILVTAISSFWITGLAGIGRFSVIHILSVITIVAAAGAVLAIRRGHVRTHRNAVIALFVGSMIGAGAGAFAPGRLLAQVFGYG